MNDLTGEIVTAAGVVLAVWSINGDCLAVVNTSQLPSDFIVSVAGCNFSDWQDTNWFVSGHQSGAVKVWKMVHTSSEESAQSKPSRNPTGGLRLGDKVPEYRLILHKVVPHSRRDTDSYNDETFGSMECTSEHRGEEERKRSGRN